jgi:nitrile hydratase accessory protein
LSAPDLPGLPCDPAGAPVVPGLWQARAFALAVHLNERGRFAWPDFAATLGAKIAADPEADYWHAWTRALEALLAAQAPADTVAATAAAWQRAAEATPHGTPIRLENAPGWRRRDGKDSSNFSNNT